LCLPFYLGVMKKLDSKLVYKDKGIIVYNDVFKDERGKEEQKARVKRMNSAAAILIVENRILMEVCEDKREPDIFRYSLNGYYDDYLETLKRGMHLELGVKAGSIISLGEILPDPVLDTKVLLYLASELRIVCEEVFASKKFTLVGFDEAYSMVMNSAITDAVTQIAILKTYSMKDIILEPDTDPF